MAAWISLYVNKTLLAPECDQLSHEKQNAPFFTNITELDVEVFSAYYCEINNS